MKNRETFKVVVAASLVAIAFALDFVTGVIPGLNLSMPLGGRFIGISLFPLALIGFWLGFKYGLIAGVIYGLISFFYDGYGLSFFATNLSDALLVFFLDYIVAFGGFAITGLFKQGLEKRSSFILGTVTAISIRWASSTIVGAILWVSYATSHDWTTNLLGSLNGNALLYSGIYNIIYNFTTAIVLILIGMLSFKQLGAIRENYLELSSN